MNIAVIGAGIAGIAVAIRLASQGHEVHVFEKNAAPGGKLGEIRQDGFRFDTGPSLLTLPEQIQDLFRAAGEPFDPDDHFYRLPETCRYFYPDGKKLAAFADHNQFIKACVQEFGEAPQHIEKYLAHSKKLYDITADIFLFNSLHRISNYTRWKTVKSMMQLGTLRFYKTMHRENNRTFDSPHLVQLFDRYATYNGSNPYKAPATLNIISHLEHNLGAWFPKKGMYSIIEMLVELANKKGVTFHVESPISKIEFDNKRAIGLWHNDSLMKFDHIVSNADAKYTALNLMPHPTLKRVKRLEPSSSALIFYWGVKRTFSELGVHNILFSGDYQAEFDFLFDKKSLYRDPTVYIFSSCKIVPSDAPKGAENWFVMINAPANYGQDWEALIHQARSNIKDKINKELHINIDQYILFERLASPLTIEADTFSIDGALYGTSSNSMFSAFLRHPNFLRGFKNLHFVGGSVHPGGGIPLCLAGAKIVADDMARRF